MMDAGHMTSHASHVMQVTDHMTSASSKCNSANGTIVDQRKGESGPSSSAESCDDDSGSTTVDQYGDDSGFTTVDHCVNDSSSTTVDHYGDNGGSTTVDQYGDDSGSTTVDQYEDNSGSTTVDHYGDDSGHLTVRDLHWLVARMDRLARQEAGKEPHQSLKVTCFTCSGPCAYPTNLV